MTELIVKYNGDILSVSERIGASAEILSEQYAILTLEPYAIDDLYGFSEVEDIEFPKRLYSDSKLQLSSSCIRSVQDPSGYNLTGRGVITAIIDSGIDFTHPAFRNSSGMSRIQFLWDQTASGIPPSGFSQGAEFTKQDIDIALLSDDPFVIIPSRDTSGHGTAVAGVAAGIQTADYSGVAIDSDLIIVKVGKKGNDIFAMTTDLMRALRYVIDKSRELGMPVAVNMSFGMNNGFHNGQSLFEEYISDAAGWWKNVIVIPTGNEGSSGHHYSTKLRSGEIKEIEFFSASGIESFYISLKKNFVDSFSAELITPGGFSSGIIRSSDSSRFASGDGVNIFIRYGQPTRYTAEQEIFFQVTSADNSTIKPGLWRIRLSPSVIVDGQTDIWLPTTEEVTAKTYFVSPDPWGTITIPSTASNVIRVAGYDDRLGSIAEFSGKGSLGGIIPDIAAPAVNVPAPRPGGGYDSYTGTSFAAPFVTGSAAIMMEWGISQGNSPFLYGEAVKAYLRLGAMRSDGISYPNPSFGYGRLCLANSVSAMLERRYARYIPVLNGG